MNLKGFLITIIMVVMCTTQAFASMYSDSFSTDTKIREALVLLENANADEVFENLSKNSVKIVFYDLSQVSYDYMTHFAINSVDSFGNRYILINSRYNNASIEEIACLIAHESCHTEAVATLEEEIYATETEAYYWNLLKDETKTYKSSDLLDRLNSLKALQEASTKERNLIAERIISSTFYMNQLAVVR